MHQHTDTQKKHARTQLSGLLPGELEEAVVRLGEKRYRAVQIFSAIHSKGVDSAEGLSQIPSALRQLISGEFEISLLRPVRTSVSELHDTQKFLFTLTRLPEVKIETVLISEKGRNTVCVSTQAGCNVGCEFCATAKLGFRANLTPGEICSQVYLVKKLSGADVTNVVYMGMGEPFLNYDSVLRSLLLLTNEKGLSLPGRRITVSTVGFRQKISKFADDISLPENSSIRKVKLALSLHSTDNGIRESLIPSSSKNRLPDIYKELVYFYRMTGTKITYEYIHFPGINDNPDDIKRLASLSRMLPCNINVIPFHPISGELNGLLAPLNLGPDPDTKKLLSNHRLNDLIASLRDQKVVVNLRNSSGVDINAACGQLALAGEKHLSETH
ncbi:MAG: 23S rRNA (adenine(2503)-C(2))-methyltransferase RlmN [Ignavibacteria bacterium]|nr:23S rRNA (adenine(2503)-C(2))-methyltransferase RlmN [Ignavibacteria bacterium]